MKKIIIVGVLVILATLTACTSSQGGGQESMIKVLYVGQDPNTVEGYSYGGDREYIEELKQTRAAEFMGLLTEHFDTTLVYGERYKPEMSASYDVTIFDALPMELDGRDMDGSGALAKPGERYQYAGTRQGWRWLPEDFDHATIFVAGTLNNMSRNVNLAMTVLCNCLDKTAFNLDTEHPIFNTPHKVPLVYRETRYAGGVYHYYTGRNLPASTQMIQMEVDDLPGKPLPPGIVTHPGVGDSPDTEMISGGTCIKDVDAVAIARHGNFFQWGYRASPRHMTETAKLAFINSVHYIKGYKGARKLIAKKAQFRLAALDDAYHLSDQGWAIKKAFYERMEAKNDELREKVASGNATEQEKKYAKFLRKPRKIERSRGLSDMPAELKEMYGEDWNSYLAYYEANIGYIYAVDDGHGFQFDKDAQALGIANSDVAILDKAISLLEKGQTPDMANRILARYTEQKFDSAADWRRWFDANREQLFFSEVGGYKFFMNTL